MSKYQCPDCEYIYDEDKGCEHEGYPAGTHWQDLPEDFPCPECFVFCGTQITPHQLSWPI
jgi:rubredoxin